MQIQSTPTTRTVIIATHCPNNTVESYYAHSLADSIYVFAQHNIRIIPLFINDIQLSVVAKNEIIPVVLENECESVIFVDYNLAWDPYTLLDIVNSKYDAVAIPVTKKVPGNVIFDLDIGLDYKTDNNGYISVNYASLAMFKLSYSLLTALTDSSISITNPSGKEVKNVFEYDTSRGKFFNDSIVLCNKIKNLGFTVWINPKTTCANIADNIYAADFAATLINIPKSDQIRSLYE